MLRFLTAIFVAGLWPLSLEAAGIVNLAAPQGFLSEAAHHARPYAIKQTGNRGQELRFELRSGDCAKPFDCRSNRERSEIKEVWRAPVGQTVWYRFELKLPHDYAEMSPKQIIGQWHDGARPALSNRYENGVFWVDLMGGENRTTHRFVLSGFRKGRWQDLRYAIHWSPDADGSLTVWHNDERVISYSGPTLSSDWKKGPRFKIGLYRSHLDRIDTNAPTQVAYARGYQRSIGSSITGEFKHRPLPR